MSGEPHASPAFAGPVRHLYLHVPFCRAKCDYCDFASSAVGERPDDDLLDGYVEGVAAEWGREQAAHDVRRLHTLYLGGGTPSLLGPGRLERLLELFRPYLTAAAEITVEANPEDVDETFAAWAGGARRSRGRRAGTTGSEALDAGLPLRVSLGVQSFSAAARAGLGRRAQTDPAAAAARLRAAGVRNLSIDLMYGLPGQTHADVEGDSAVAVALRPEHVSWYELQVVPGTPLYERRPSGPEPEERAAMYRLIVQALSRAGYGWYEVSNYALPGRRARHNVAYWRARPYVGLGPGAVSTVGARRWTNTADLGAWRAALAAGGDPPRELEELDTVTRARERLMLAARHGGRVPVAELADQFDQAAALRLSAAGLVSLHNGTIRVTRKGRYVADEVCVRLFRD